MYIEFGQLKYIVRDALNESGRVIDFVAAKKQKANKYISGHGRPSFLNDILNCILNSVTENPDAKQRFKDALVPIVGEEEFREFVSGLGELYVIYHYVKDQADEEEKPRQKKLWKIWAHRIQDTMKKLDPNLNFNSVFR